MQKYFFTEYDVDAALENTIRITVMYLQKKIHTRCIALSKARKSAGLLETTQSLFVQTQKNIRLEHLHELSHNFFETTAQTITPLIYNNSALNIYW